MNNRVKLKTKGLGTKDEAELSSVIMGFVWSSASINLIGTDGMRVIICHDQGPRLG